MNLCLNMTIGFKEKFPEEGIYVWFDGIEFRYKGKIYRFYEEDSCDVAYGFDDIDYDKKEACYSGKIKGMMFVDEDFNELSLDISDVFGKNFDINEFEFLEIVCPLSDDDDDDGLNYCIKSITGMFFESNYESIEYEIEKEFNIANE